MNKSTISKVSDVARRSISVVTNDHINSSVAEAKSQLVKTLYNLSVCLKGKIRTTEQPPYLGPSINTTIKEFSSMLVFGIKDTTTVSILSAPQPVHPSMQEDN